MRKSGPLMLLATLVTAALAGCSRSPEQGGPATAGLEPEREALEIPAPEKVRVDVPDAPVAAATWRPPEVDLGEADLEQVRRNAARALAAGQLYQHADDAIPLYLAILQLQPQDRVATAGLARARQQLQRDVDALLAQREHQRDALAGAAERAAVLRTLAPDDPAVQELQERVELARRVQAFNRAGEAELRAGRPGDDSEGALARFRAALALDPEDSRALQGVAAVESAMIARAEQAAAAADFQQAAQWLARAEGLRPGAETVADARVRIELMRAARLTALRDAALRKLTNAQGLRPARAILAEAERIALPDEPVVALLRERIELATRYGSFRPGQVFTDALQDGGRGPQMIVIPHGSFEMGASDDEPGAVAAERPRHTVRFERGFAMSITEVTVAEFGRFVASAGARPRATRRGHSTVYDERSGNFARRSGVDWRSGYNGARAAPNDPVMHVSVRDAEAYAAWLSEQTGRHYRLPSEAEFEYALRAGRSGRFPWGDDRVPPEGMGNFTGSEDVSPSGRRWNNAFIGYGDGYWGPAPVASFRPNPWGLHDMGGNLSEWVADCWHSSYRRAPSDGVAWFNPGCRQRLVRGGNWANAPEQVRAAWRLQQDSDVTSARIGFRLVRGI